ncbi:uncharacterized protein LOC121755580 [Salvia splendens]|uniref:uncharacterized protein LOC121755580 n=1 Tax=Salvia splendens TaxID=180675 RepID=UPI001C258A14|nr:uncharacterized protein LOC121755580 [Salvia splendens]
MAAAEELAVSDRPCLHMISAFLALEPPDIVISYARELGGGSITESVQRCIWLRCISKADLKLQGPFLKRFLKKLINEIESSGEMVLDELCSIWPSSLFMSEFILSFPEIFANKCCFEVGSGVGLVGICLSYVKASKVILTDGDFSTLANTKVNLELNNLTTANHTPDSRLHDKMVQCVYLPWESASEDDIHCFAPRHYVMLLLMDDFLGRNGSPVVVLDLDGSCLLLVSFWAQSPGT